MVIRDRLSSSSSSSSSSSFLFSPPSLSYISKGEENEMRRTGGERREVLHVQTISAAVTPAVISLLPISLAHFFLSLSISLPFFLLTLLTLTHARFQTP